LTSLLSKSILYFLCATSSTEFIAAGFRDELTDSVV
jgi:hypothetical protein